MKKLIELNIVHELESGESFNRGDIIRRINSEKDQQGCFERYDDEGNPVLVNVIDMRNAKFAAEAGIMRFDEEDTVYRFNDTFIKSSKANAAMTLLREWPLYKKNPDLQIPMEYFMMLSYSPIQILDFKKTSNMKFLFIPIQQKFKIGRFEEKINWNLERKKRFEDYLNSLEPGDHITYVALVPQNNSYSPMFYSVGTKPHQSTHDSLKTEPFSFEPTHGGHIKAVKDKKGNVEYIVDAGSSYLGKGIKTPLSKAEEVAKALTKLYSDKKYKPVEGRNAFGSMQSY